ncbi:MAG: PQQ-like beta-propeller repeat protein, partial [Deltaproteobacteria bacterium]|nr:PQQ-like beta-propeller repeat protein [Deltaproteobacteria bacterium]
GERVAAGGLFCLSSQGVVRWDRNLRAPSWFTPLVDSAGNSFVGSDAHLLYAFDTRGEVRFHLRVDGDVDSSAAFMPDGSIVFPAGDQIYAITPEGETKWRFRADAKIFSAPVVDSQGSIYFGSQDDHLYALSAQGELLFRYRTGGDVDSSPALGDDGDLYFGSDDHRVYRLGRDGELRWSTDLDGYIRAPVALGDGVVIASVFGPRPRVVALSARDGSLAWYFPVTVADSSEVGSRSGPIVDRDGNIYVGAHDDYLYSLTSNGELRWAFQTEGDVDSSPALAPDGTLYFGSDDGMLYALEDVQ